MIVTVPALEHTSELFAERGPVDFGGGNPRVSHRTRPFGTRSSNKAGNGALNLIQKGAACPLNYR
ncbi:hypothetical protein [Streptomyces sp. NPDC047009]|uniref:hypothetical protein n=1 Tax=unclassified Streptomyces TaxID=2593676 RepID=UPI0033EA8EE2